VKKIDVREADKYRVKQNVSKSKYVWKRTDHINKKSNDDEVRIIEKKTDGNQNVVDGQLPATSLYCNHCKFQCRNQVRFLHLLIFLAFGIIAVCISSPFSEDFYCSVSSQPSLVFENLINFVSHLAGPQDD